MNYQRWDDATEKLQLWPVSRLRAARKPPGVPAAAPFDFGLDWTHWIDSGSTVSYPSAAAASFYCPGMLRFFCN